MFFHKKAPVSSETGAFSCGGHADGRKIGSGGRSPFGQLPLFYASNKQKAGRHGEEVQRQVHPQFAHGKAAVQQIKRAGEPHRHGQHCAADAGPGLFRHRRCLFQKYAAQQHGPEQKLQMLPHTFVYRGKDRRQRYGPKVVEEVQPGAHTHGQQPDPNTFFLHKGKTSLPKLMAGRSNLCPRDIHSINRREFPPCTPLLWWRFVSAAPQRGTITP